MMFQWAQKPDRSIENLLKFEIGEEAWNTCKREWPFA